MTAPTVSVVMSVYNGERYLREAIESILQQTFTDFEFIIMDDGSTDNTWDILAGYANQDQRIALVRNEETIGLTKSLNRGLALARGEYIARQDADDVSLPERLEQQVAFLDSRLSVGLVGSNYFLVDGNGAILGDVRGLGPLTGGMVKWRLLWENIFIHPSVLFRHHLVKALGCYPEDHVYAQDYALWLRLGLETEMAILSQPLICLREHDNRISRQHRNQQLRAAATSSQQALGRFTGSRPSLAAVQLAQGFRLADAGPYIVEEASALIRFAYQAIVGTHNLCQADKDIIRADAARRLYKLALKCVGVHPAAALRAFLAAVRMAPSWTLRLDFVRGFVIRLFRGAASRLSRLRSHSPEIPIY